MARSTATNIIGFRNSQRSGGNSHEMAAKLSALDKSQACIEFELDGTIIAANQNFLDI